MELTEKERLMLVENKKEIQKLTSEILGIMDDPEQATKIKRKITNILSILSTIGSYARPKDDLGIFSTMAESIFADLTDSPTPEFLWHFVVKRIGKFCIYTNSIQFDFTRKDLKIIIPKIDISIFRTK
jgi:hypothetical protein